MPKTPPEIPKNNPEIPKNPEVLPPEGAEDFETLAFLAAIGLVFWVGYRVYRQNREKNEAFRGFGTPETA